MRIVVLPDAEAVASYGAQLFIDQLQQNPQSVLGLATGSSPLLLYKKLIAANRDRIISFAQAHSFNLDEYLGLPAGHPQSYRFFMDGHLFQHIDIKPENTHIPDGSDPNPTRACAHYEQQIATAGGIHLQLLGIGRNGHIGFNEPSSSLTSRTRVKTLTPDTVAANRRFFSDDEFQPRLSLTMGIGTIMEARKIVLIATGSDKADAVQATIEGPVSAFCPASILQMHADATVIVDEQAAGKLRDIAFYQYIEQEQQRIAQALT